MKKIFPLTLIAVLLAGPRISASPALQPYTADANTLFLFHLDEAAGGSVTTNVGLLGGNAYTVNETTSTTTPPLVTNVLGASAYTNFGNAATFASGEIIGFDYNKNGRYDGDGGATQLSADSFSMSVLNMGNGGQTPWTLEAMIYPSSINVANQEIICTDSSATAAAARAFQFRLNTSGELELNLIAISGADIATTVPSTATDPINGFVSNNWYHVAAVYDGTNVVLYWTRVLPTTVAANPISTNAVAVGASFGSVQGSLGIGNRTRTPAVEYFQGNIDEVRISSIARAANQMLFSSGGSSTISASATVITPGNPVYAGTPVVLSATVFGTQPISYVWQGDGGTGGITWTNLPNATTNTYALNTTGMPQGNYEYRLVVTNTAGAATNTPATLNLLAASGPVLVANTSINPSNAFAGGPVFLFASFSGTQPLSFQWYFTTNGGGAALIPGATNTSYTIARAQTNNAGSYFLMASNNPPGLGSSTLASTPPALTISPDFAASSGMFCDLLEHPEETILSASAPKFGWFYVPSFRNDYQAAYRIIVASSQSLVNAGTGDMWDSGMVTSSNSINVSYGGTALQAGTSYFWRVQTINSLSQTNAFSAVQQFNTAGQLANPLTTGGVVYQQPGAGSANCYPLRYVPVSPVLVTMNNLGHWFIDFGNDAFGYATLHLNGNYGGSTVGFGLGEMAANNIINTSPGATIRYWSGSYSLQNGDVIYTNRSSTAVGTISPPAASYGIVSPFRYLELSGVPARVVLTTNDVTQWRLQTEFDPSAATFACSSASLNQVWNLCHYSMEALTFDGIYVDGDRERLPYEADTYFHQMGSYGSDNDFITTRCAFEYLTNHLTWPTEWPMHMIFVAWADYEQTGDPYLMTKYYGFLTNKCMLYANARANGLVWSYPITGNTASGDIIDWYRLSGDGIGNIDGYVAEGTNAVINAFYYRCLTIMTNVAELTGHHADAANFAARAGLVYNNYNTVFWSSGSQSYMDGVGTSHSSVDANFFPLDFGLVPVSSQAETVNYIHSRIAALSAMPAGVYGAQYLLEGLFQAGDSDTALGLMITNNTRSWMNMINIGSTLTDEAWSVADKSNEDWNHAWGSAPGNLIPRYVLGLLPLAAGYGQVLIQPHLGATLAFAQGTIPTIRGPVSILASNVPGQFQLLLNIPGNVTATVMLPATNATAILDGAVVSGILSTDILSNCWLTITNVGSGQHALWASSSSTPSTTTLYNNWASSWFGTNAANPAIAGPNADPDGDGFDNYAEFIAGTDPTNPQSRFTINGLTGAALPISLSVTVEAQLGRTYVLQRNLNLDTQTWMPVATNNTAVSNQILTLSDPQPVASQAFYRVSVTMP